MAGKAKSTAGKTSAAKKETTPQEVEGPVVTSIGYEGDVPTTIKEPKAKELKSKKTDDWEVKDRTYVLLSTKQPIMETIPVKHTMSRPLLWFDPEKKYERELRYATNQKSCFVDEQEGHVTLAHIAFRNGSLFVPKSKVALQKLLSLYHPLNGTKYAEVNEIKRAEDELDVMDIRLEAELAASKMDIDLMESIMRVEIGNAVSRMTTKELKRDARLFAMNNPKLFLDLANDENIVVRNMGIKAVEAGILELAADQRTFNWKSTGRKVMTVPFDENPYSALAAFFKTDDGIEIYQSIEKRLG
jgi:hypothetical protein